MIDSRTAFGTRRSEARENKLAHRASSSNRLRFETPPAALHLLRFTNVSQLSLSAYMPTPAAAATLVAASSTPSKAPGSPCIAPVPPPPPPSPLPPTTPCRFIHASERAPTSSAQTDTTTLRHADSRLFRDFLAPTKPTDATEQTVPLYRRIPYTP